MIERWKPGALRRDTIIAAVLVIAGIVLAIGLFLAGALWRRKTAAAHTSSGFRLCDSLLPESSKAWRHQGGLPIVWMLPLTKIACNPNACIPEEHVDHEDRN